MRDLRIGARTLSRTPGFALIAILTTALGTGASIALFTVVRGVLLRPLPFPGSDRLLTLYERSTPAAGGGDFLDASWETAARALEKLKLYIAVFVSLMRRRASSNFVLLP